MEDMNVQQLTFLSLFEPGLLKSLRIQLQEKLPSFDQLKESTRHDKV